jgi:hypothetical protein
MAACFVRVTVRTEGKHLMIFLLASTWFAEENRLHLTDGAFCFDCYSSTHIHTVL